MGGRHCWLDTLLGIVVGDGLGSKVRLIWMVAS